MSSEILVAISGSFKFKDKIDEACRRFESLGVRVLAPEKGWIYTPYPNIQIRSSTPGFRPLPGERELSIRQIEDNFLHAVRLSSFLYLVDINGYFGISAALEIGFAHACNKSIYASEPPSQFLDLETQYLKLITVLPVSESVNHYRQSLKPVF